MSDQDGRGEAGALAWASATVILPAGMKHELQQRARQEHRTLSRQIVYFLSSALARERPPTRFGGLAMAVNRAHFAALAAMDLNALSDQQRQNLSRFFQVHPGGIDALHRWAKQTSPPPPPGAGPARVSDEVYARMGPSERLEYARQFNQSEMPAWHDPRVAR